MSDGVRIASESLEGAANWGEMGPGERLKLVMIAAGADAPGGVEGHRDRESLARIELRVREHFGPDGPGDFFDATNVVLREASREDHGDTAAWDRSLAATGKTLPPSAIDALMARKSEMTQDEFMAAHLKLLAPQQSRAGLIRWSAQVESPTTGGLFVPVSVEWPGPGKVATVTVAGRKVNGKHRRRWLALLSTAGVTFERVRDAHERGAQRVSTGS